MKLISVAYQKLRIAVSETPIGIGVLNDGEDEVALGNRSGDVVFSSHYFVEADL